MEIYIDKSTNSEEEIYRELQELDLIYKNISDVLQEQDKKIDSIIDNMDIIKLDVEKTKKDLEIAESYQKSATWKKINLFGFLTLITCIFK
jgi:t-SNARE complex subunit (syntaxin)